MKPEFVPYLESFVLPAPVMAKIESIFNFYTTYCEEDIANIFITDYVNNDGSRVLEDLWFFSEHYGMEAKQFITTDDFDMTSISKRIVYWDIKKQDYDFNTAVATSRLYIMLTFDSLVTADFKASGNNCSKLKEIFVQHILPNLRV
jgi:hypothetical protein